MMEFKNYLVSLISLPVMLCCGAESSFADNVVKIRPVTILVQDARTGGPLKGIAVNYIVIRRAAYTSTLWIFPPIEPLIENSIEVKKSAFTDEKGEANFDDVEVGLREYWFRSRVDRIDSEEFFINLEPADKASVPAGISDSRKDKYEFLDKDLPFMKYSTSPNINYKGYVLTNANITEAHWRDQGNICFDFRPLDLSLEKAIFTVKLPRVN